MYVPASHLTHTTPRLRVRIKFQKFAFVNGANAQLALDGGNEGRTLKEGARERFHGAVQFEVVVLPVPCGDERLRRIPFPPIAGI